MGRLVIVTGLPNLTTTAVLELAWFDDSSSVLLMVHLSCAPLGNDNETAPVGPA